MILDQVFLMVKMNEKKHNMDLDIISISSA